MDIATTSTTGFARALNRDEKEIKMKVSEMFPKKYIAASDLGDKVFTVTISGFGPMAEFDDGNRPVLMFQESQKGLVLKPSIASVLAWLFGDETDDWIGKQVQMYNELVTFRGKTGPAVRLRGVDSAAAQTAVINQPVQTPAPQTPSGTDVIAPQPQTTQQPMGPGEQAATHTVGQPVPGLEDDEIPF